MITKTVPSYFIAVLLAVLIFAALAFAITTKLARAIVLGVEQSKDVRISAANTCAAESDDVHFVGCSSIL